MKRQLLYSATFAAILFAAPHAIAQTEGENANQDEYRDTIIVQAQRRDQNILDVPVAVTTMSAADLDAKQVNNVLEIVNINPSVSGVIDGLSSPLHNTPLRIRGIGTGGGNPGFEGAVGMYVDEVFRSRAGAALTSFFDMHSVDILRGPQGTLFGKNTTAGAILQKTRSAEIGETGGYVSAQYGSFNTVEVEGALNLPLGENGAFRLSGVHDASDGFFTDPLTDEDVAEQDTQAIRAQFVFEPTDRLAFRLVGEWSDFRNTGNYNRSTRVDNRDPVGAQAGLFAPLALNLVPGAPGTGTGYWYWDITTPGAEADPFAREISTAQVGLNELEQWGINGYVDYDLNDNVSIRSITSYREIDSVNINGDWDFGPVNVAGRLDGFQTFETFSQEVLVQGDADLGGITLDWTAGVHYFNEEIVYDRDATAGPTFAVLFGAAPGDPLLGNPDAEFQNITNGTDEEAWGIFAHTTFELTDSLSLIAGGRWNNIQKDGFFVNNTGEGAAYFDFVTSNSLGFVLADGGLTTAFNWDNSLENEEWTYNFALQWRPIDEVQLYASYSRGFKAGGFNLTPDGAAGTPSLGASALPLEGLTPTVTVPLVGTIPRLYTPFDPDLAIFDPEFVDAYEVGARYQFPGGLISLTGFWSDYSDLQTSVFTGLVFQVINAGTAQTRGIELEGSYNVTDNLSINGGLTYLDATYGDDVRGLPGGRDLVQAPDLALAFSAQYDRPLTNNIDLFANASVSYTTEYFAAEDGCFDATGEPSLFSDCDPNLLGGGSGAALPNALANEIQDGYALLNLTLGLRLPSEFEVSVFCNNCTDTEYFGWRFNQPFIDGGILGNPNAPRTWGGRVSKRF